MFTSIPDILLGTSLEVYIEFLGTSLAVYIEFLGTSLELYIEFLGTSLELFTDILGMELLCLMLIRRLRTIDKLMALGYAWIQVG